MTLSIFNVVPLQAQENAGVPINETKTDTAKEAEMTEVSMEGDFGGMENNTLHWSLETDDKFGYLLTVSGNGPMKDYDAASDTPWNKALENKKEKAAIKIENGITRIGKHSL